MFRRIFTFAATAAAAVAVAVAVATPATAEPTWKTEGLVLSCTQNGQPIGTATFSGGGGPNQSPIAFVISDASFATAHSIFIQAYIVLTIGDETFTALDKPLPAQKDLITCTGGGVLDNGVRFTVVTTGFITPAP